MENEASAPELFRPSKRRKFYRRKIEAEAEDDEAASAPPNAPAPAPEPMTVDELISHGGDGSSTAQEASGEAKRSINDIIRQRKAIQRRKGGIEFTNHDAAHPSPETSNQLVRKEDVEDEISEDIRNVISRFAPQTGQITEDTDKHMYVSPCLPLLPKIIQIQRLTQQGWPT